MRVEEIQILAAEVLVPPPDLTVSEWADRNRRLSSESAAEKGEWRTDRAPYQRAIMDALSPGHPAETVVVMSAAQLGKCLAVATPIATPAGWTTMGELQVGDRVFDECGHRARVTGTSDVFRDHACYRLGFDDGKSIVADAEHRWPVRDAQQAGRWVTISTAEMAGSYLLPAGAFRYRIDCPAVVELAGRALAKRSRSIVSIEAVAPVPVRCIAVDYTPSRLFLAGRGMIPTHNSSMLENFVGYIIDLDPGPLLLAEPREVDAEAFSKDRLAPMLRDTPCLRGKVADARSRDSNNTILHKKFLGGSITLAAANSPAGLAMRSIRYCLLDEVDRYPASAGSEGDPVNLAITRTANFWNRKIVLCSTPTTKGSSRIEAAWLHSNQQSYWVPCPHCAGFQVLRWDNLIWPKGEPEKAEYRCEHCAWMIGDWQKHGMLEAGEWRAERPEVTDTAGFWINGLYSPWRRWGALAKKFLSDKRSPETLREFVNTVLAEPWDDEAETSVDRAVVMARREHYRAAVPFGAAVLTAGVDVQKDRLELELVGWGRGEESWSLAFRVLLGDPSGAALWRELDEYLERRWPHEAGISLPVAACAIDSGYESQAVYEFCRTRYHRRIFAVKGRGGPLPVWQRKPTAKTIRGEKPWTVGTDTAKETIYGRLKNPTPGTPGYSHFPADREESYFEQLLGEVLVTTYSRGQPKREWRAKPGVRQEALDARVYAYAALRALVSMGLRLDVEAERIEALRPEAGSNTKGLSEVSPPPGRRVLRSNWLESGARRF